MQLNLNMTHPMMIKSHTDTSISLNGKIYDNDLILTNESIFLFDKPLSKPENITYSAIETHLYGDLLIIGHKDNAFLHHYPLMQSLFKEKQMGLEIMKIGSACRTFNVLLSESRPISLILVF